MSAISTNPLTVRPVSWSAPVASVAVLSLLLVMPATVCCWTIPPDDPDAWWHLRTGQWMLENGAWPTTDAFTAYGAGRPFPAYSWLPELALFGLYQAMGLRGLVLFSAALCAAITAAVYHLVWRQGAGLIVAGSLTLAAMLGMKPLMTARPWLVTILLFTIELDLLLSARRTGQFRRLLWLPPLFCLWANAHIQFTVGLALLGLAVVEPWPAGSRRFGPARMLGILLLCVAATLVNPYHVGLYRTALGLMGQPALWGCIQELAAMRFRSYADWAVLGVTLASVFALGWHRRCRLLLALAFPAAVYFSFRSGRDVWMVLVVGAAVLGRCVPWGRASTVRLSPAGGLAVAGIVAAVLAANVWTLDESTLSRQVAASYPSEALEFVRQQNCAGPVFTQFEWGGYLMFHVPGLRVNIDGRTIVHGQERMLRNVDTLLGRGSWSEDPELLAAQLIVVPTKYVLTPLLERDPRFQVRYRDSVTAVFVLAERPPGPAPSEPRRSACAGSPGRS